LSGSAATEERRGGDIAPSSGLQDSQSVQPQGSTDESTGECYFKPSLDLILFVLFQAEKAYALALSVRFFISTDSEKLQSLSFGKLSRGMIHHFRRAAERARMAEDLYAALPGAVTDQNDWKELRSLYSPDSVALTVDELRLYRNCICAALSQQEDDYIDTLRALQVAGLLTLRLAESSTDSSVRDARGIRSLEVLLGRAEAGDALSLGPDGEPVDPATGIPALDAFLHLFAKPLENSRGTVLAFIGPSQANRQALDRDLEERSIAELKACGDVASGILALVQNIELGPQENDSGSISLFAYKPLKSDCTVTVSLPEGAVRRAISHVLSPDALLAIQADLRGAFAAISEIYFAAEKEVMSRPAQEWIPGLQEFVGFRPEGRRFGGFAEGRDVLRQNYKLVSSYIDVLSGAYRVISDYSERPAPRGASRLKELSARLSADVSAVRKMYSFCMVRHYALHIINPGMFGIAGTPMQDRPEDVICTLLSGLLSVVMPNPPASITPRALATILNSDGFSTKILGLAGSPREDDAVFFLALCRVMYCAIATRYASSFAAASVSPQFYAKERGLAKIEYPGTRSPEEIEDAAAEGSPAPSDFNPASALQSRLEAAQHAFSAVEALSSTFSGLLANTRGALSGEAIAAILGLEPTELGVASSAFSNDKVRGAACCLERIGEELHPLSVLAAKGLSKPEDVGPSPSPCMPVFVPTVTFGDAVPDLLNWEYVFEVEDAVSDAEEQHEGQEKVQQEEGEKDHTEVGLEQGEDTGPQESEAPLVSQPAPETPNPPESPARPVQPVQPVQASEPTKPTPPPRKQGLMSKLTSFLGFGSTSAPTEQDDQTAAPRSPSPKQKKLFGLF